MKTYQLITQSGNCYTINAPEWQQARRKARITCNDKSERFSSVRLVRESSAPLFDQKPKAASQSVRDLSKYVGQIVTFTLYSASGQWLGIRWGVLEAVLLTSGKTPVVKTESGYFNPQPKHVVTTGKRPIEIQHEKNSPVS